MKRIKKNDGIDKGKVLEFKQAGENSLDQELALRFKQVAENSVDHGLALKLEFVYADYHNNPEFMNYLETIPALFRMYEFEMAYHPFFGMFLEGIPKLIAILGEDVD